jgi:hypothetical protein
MSDSELRTLVQRAVDETLEHHLDSLRGQLVSQICAQLGAMGTPAQSGAVPSAVLSAALNSIQRGTTQADILAALLQSTEPFARRAALLVLRGGAVVGWRSRGFSGGEPKGVTINSTSPLVDRVLAQRIPVSGPAAEFDSAFLAGVGRPAGDVLLVPLLVRDKVAAVLYADEGLPPGAIVEGRPAGRMDADALDCLVRFAGTWVELMGVRKAGASSPAEPETRRSLEASTAHSLSGKQESEHELQIEEAFPATRAAVASAVDPFAAPSSSSVASAGVQTQVMDEGELHRKARRFAKLLVDEIRLYNQEKVEEGRRNADLSSRLGMEIEKSRTAYAKRYGHSLGDSADYFQQELVRILANNNPDLLGSEDSS